MGVGPVSLFLYGRVKIMAYAKIVFENENTVTPRLEAPVGFSWTMLFFSWMVPVSKKDFKWAAIMALCELLILLAFLAFPLAIVILPIPKFLFAFIYNKIRIKKLIEEGWKAKSLSPPGGPNDLGALLDSLKAKWNIEIPRIEDEKAGGGKEK